MTRGYVALGLVQPKTPANVGSVLRAAGCYAADVVIIEGERGKRTREFVTGNPTDTMKQWRHIPTISTNDLLESMPVGAMPVIVELIGGAVPLPDFKHPERAFYIFGPEDGTLGVRHARPGIPRVFIPTTGCMNLAATVNVVLYDRLVKTTSRTPAPTVQTATAKEHT